MDRAGVEGVSCKDCLAAETDPWWGGYMADCEPCQARMLSHSPEHWEAAKAQRFTPNYTQRLYAVFRDRWEEGHEAVMAITAARLAALSAKGGPSGEV